MNVYTYIPKRAIIVVRTGTYNGDILENGIQSPNLTAKQTTIRIIIIIIIIIIIPKIIKHSFLFKGAEDKLMKNQI